MKPVQAGWVAGICSNPDVQYFCLLVRNVLKQEVQRPDSDRNFEPFFPFEQFL